MPDNVTLPGTGAEIATDEVDDGAGLRQFQLVKLAHGIDGAAAMVSTASGLPVQGVGELMEAIEALRMSVASLTRTIGMTMPDTAGRQRVLLDAITASLTLSSAAVASSRTKIRGDRTRARAIAMRCLCPPDSCIPREPHCVW